MTHEASERASLLSRDDVVRRRRSARAAQGALASTGALACVAALGLWTHKARTLQEQWRPIPGNDGEMTSTSKMTMMAGDGAIARWGRSSSVVGEKGVRARLGDVAFTGVAATPAQMGALRALRMQIRNAMFNPATSSQTVDILMKQLEQIVPEAGGMLQGTITVNDLEAAVKELMARSETAAPAAASVEGEFRQAMVKPVEGDAAIEVAIADEEEDRSTRLVAPATTYETALRETMHAADRSRDRSESTRHHKEPTTNEQSTMEHNNDLQAMINSLDGVGGATATEPAYSYAEDVEEEPREERVAPAESFDNYLSVSNVQALEPTRRVAAAQPVEVQPPWIPVVQQPQPQQQWVQQPQPQQQQPVEALALDPTISPDVDAMLSGASPVPFEPATTVVSLPAPVESTVESFDDSWVTSFQGEISDDARAAKSVDALLSIPGVGAAQPALAQAQAQAQAALPQQPIVAAVPQPTPVVPQPVPTSAQPVEDLVNALTEALRAQPGDGSYSSSSSELGTDSALATSSVKLTSPRETDADADAIVASVLALIQNRMQSKDATASMGAGGFQSREFPKSSPTLSKEEIAAAIARSLTEATTPVVQANAVEQAQAANADAAVDPNTQMIATAMVEHDARTAHRIAEILMQDDGVQLTRDRLSASASMGEALGSSTPSAAQNAREEAAQLIIYEEQRRSREEVQAMRRDLAALMANIQTHYAMGLTENRIDQTASTAASHIIDTLKPVLGFSDGPISGASTSKTVFDYPTVPSSRLSKTNLVLEGIMSQRKAHEEDDASESSKGDEDVDASIAAPWDPPGGGAQPKWLKDSVEASRLTASIVGAEVEDDANAIVSQRGAHLGETSKSDGSFELPGFGHSVKSAKAQKSVKDEVHAIVRGIAGKSATRERTSDEDEYEIDEETAAAVRENKYLTHRSSRGD